MKNYLYRSILLIALLSLCANGHSWLAGPFGAGFWAMGSEVQEFQMALEEGPDTGLEDNLDLKDGKKLDKGDGDDDGADAVKAKKPFYSLLFLEQDFPFLLADNSKENASRAAAFAANLNNRPSPRLFLLFHNIKSDLTHPAA